MTLDDRASEHRSRANNALGRKRWREAQGELEELLKITPDDPIAWNNLGVALEHQRKPQEALEAFARAAAIAPAGRVSRRNLVNEMQRYLGFAGALVIFEIIRIVLALLPLAASQRDAVTAITFIALALGAIVYYQRRREQLPPDAWKAYRSEMARTRRLRYGGLAFVFVGFLAFAILLFVIVPFPGGAGDSVVLLVILAGLCWLIVARVLWRRVIAPRLDRRAGSEGVD
jgi:tetratricopeptide (TPR) repeat protein